MRHKSKPRVTLRVVGAGAHSSTTAITDVAAQIATLKRMTCAELAKLYHERFGIETTTHNAQHLRRKLAAKIQLDAIPPEEKERLELLEPKALEQLRKRVEARRLRVAKVTATTDATSTTPRDPRIPPVGTILTKKHKADTHQVTVLADGFEWNGRRYDSLSRLASLITGTRWNGLLYFGLIGRKPAPRKETTDA